MYVGIYIYIFQRIHHFLHLGGIYTSIHTYTQSEICGTH